MSSTFRYCVLKKARVTPFARAGEFAGKMAGRASRWMPEARRVGVKPGIRLGAFAKLE